MADEDILKKFLVSIGFKVDQDGYNKFKSAVEQSVVRAKLMADALEGLARRGAHYLGSLTQQYSDLYWAAQRMGTPGAIQPIQAFGYAASLFGSSIEAAVGSLETFGKNMRDFPAFEAQVKSFGVETRDMSVKLAGGVYKMRDTADIMIDLVETAKKRFGPRGYPWARVWLEHFGLDDRTIQAMWNQLENFKVFSDELKHTQSLFDLDPEKIGKISTKWQHGLGQLDNVINSALARLTQTLAPTLEGLMDQFDKWMEVPEHKKQFLDMIDNLAKALAGLGLAVSDMVQSGALTAFVNALTVLVNLLTKTINFIGPDTLGWLLFTWLTGKVLGTVIGPLETITGLFKGISSILGITMGEATFGGFLRGLLLKGGIIGGALWALWETIKPTPAYGGELPAGGGKSAPSAPATPSSPAATEGGRVGGWLRKHLPESITKHLPPSLGGPTSATPGDGDHPVDTDIPREGRALLDAIATGESAGFRDPYSLTLGGGHDPGAMASGQHPGPFHDFGRYQYTYTRWKDVWRRGGFHGLDPSTQDRAAWWDAQQIYRRHTGGNLLDDLRSGKVTPEDVIGMMRGTWISLKRAHVFLRAVQRYKRAMEAPSTAPEAPAPPHHEEKKAVPGVVSESSPATPRSPWEGILRSDWRHRLKSPSHFSDRMDDLKNIHRFSPSSSSVLNSYDSGKHVTVTNGDVHITVSGVSDPGRASEMVADNMDRHNAIMIKHFKTAIT